MNGWSSGHGGYGGLIDSWRSGPQTDRVNPAAATTTARSAVADALFERFKPSILSMPAGVSGDRYWASRVIPDAQQYITQPREGMAPRQTDYLSIAPVVRSGDNPLVFDEQAYGGALFNWLRGQDRYSDWSDEELRRVVGDTAQMSDQQRAQALFWEEQRAAWDRAAGDAEADRERMLGELDKFKESINDRWMNGVLARERTEWQARIRGTIEDVIKQQAAMGRTASPWLLQQVRARLESQAADSLQMRRWELENEQRQAMQYYLGTLNQVLSDTQRNMIDPATAAQIAERLGRSDTGISQV